MGNLRLPRAARFVKEWPAFLPMNSPAITQGIVCALWTPRLFDGRTDLAALDQHLEWLGSTGLDGLLVLGSTGRFPGMPVAERETFTRHVLARVRNLPALVNISHLDLQQVARLGVNAREHGATGVTVLPPWYFEQAQADQVEWFVAAGQAANLPLWLYNFPERTGNRIELNTVKEVISRIPLAGFKNSGAHQEVIRELARLARTHPFAIFAGADARIPESIALGAVGCIGGMANALPECMVRLYQTSKSGGVTDGDSDLELLRAVTQRMHLVPFPMNVASVMEARGLNPGAVPTTMSRVTRAHYEQLKSEVRGLMQDRGVEIF